MFDNEPNKEETAEPGTNAEAISFELDDRLDLFKDDSAPDESPTELPTNREAIFVAELQDCTVEHAVSRAIPNPLVRQYEKNEFFGVSIDTCCSHHSVGSCKQYQAYCSFVVIPVFIDLSKLRNLVSVEEDLYPVARQR